MRLFPVYSLMAYLFSEGGSKIRYIQNELSSSRLIKTGDKFNTTLLSKMADIYFISDISSSWLVAKREIALTRGVKLTQRSSKVSNKIAKYPLEFIFNIFDVFFVVVLLSVRL